MKKTKNFVIFLALALIFLILSACGAGQDSDLTTIRIGASAVPHSEILQNIAPYMQSRGYNLEIIEFFDFVQPNLALAAGELDANYFQTLPFLDNFNRTNNENLIPVFGVHFEPLQIYAGRLNSIQNIPNGASVGIPEDPTNGARALVLLSSLGLLELQSDLDLANITPSDITYNPYNLQIITLPPETLPPALPDLDLAVINGNVALNGSVIDRAIYGTAEDPSSPATIPFTNWIVIRGEDYGNIPGLDVLIEAISTNEVREFILQEYSTRIVPRF